MCFPSPSPKIITETTPAPVRNTTAGLANLARVTAMKSQGQTANIATSPLGDLGFGTSLSSVSLGGATVLPYGA